MEQTDVRENKTSASQIYLIMEEKVLGKTIQYKRIRSPVETRSKGSGAPWNSLKGIKTYYSVYDSV